MSADQIIPLNAKVNQLDLSEAKTRIASALDKGFHHQDASKHALEFINDNYDEMEELIEDINLGYEECGLVDDILTNCGTNSALSITTQSLDLLNLIIRALNGDFVKTTVIQLKKLKFYDHITDKDGRSKNKNNNNNNNNNDNNLPNLTNSTSFVNSNSIHPELKQTKNWLVNQWDDTFQSWDTNVDIIKLFTIGKKQNMKDLPGVLHEIYSQWRIQYLIDKMRKNPDMNNAKDVHVSDFIRKSLAFSKLNNKNKQLIQSSLQTYGKRFSPQPVIAHRNLFQINDSLYHFILYARIMSEIINNMINKKTIQLPTQIDFWIIPKTTSGCMTDANDSDDDDSDDDDDDDDDDDIDGTANSGKPSQDCTILNIQQRFQMHNLNYFKFDGLLNDNNGINRMKRKLQSQIQSLLANKQSHNRIVCIADRRDKYYDLIDCPSSDYVEYLNQAKLNDDDDDNKISVNALDNNVKIITRNTNKAATSKLSDDIYIYQPPQSYGKFSHGYSQEHLMYLSREYILPRTILKTSTDDYKQTFGAFNDWDFQMFMLSFCCHHKDDIRLIWYVNGCNIRLTDPNNIIKIWSHFFVQKNSFGLSHNEYIKKIKNELIKDWPLNFHNNEYATYEQDLLRFHSAKKLNKNKKNKLNKFNKNNNK